MEPTKITAHLPGVDVEIHKRSLPEQHAESLTIHITAVPSFDVASRWLLDSSVLPLSAMFAFWSAMLGVWQPLGEPRLTSSDPESGRLLKESKPS